MTERLTLLRPADIGRALARAVDRVDQAPLVLDPGLVAARLAAGSFEAVRSLLRGADATPEIPLIAARYLRWTGDIPTVMAAWPVIERALDQLDAADAHVRSATLDELQPAAVDVGRPQLAARLRALARSASPPMRVRAEGDARTILDVAADLLGIAPDAVRGRIGLRVNATRYDAIEVQNIRCADASIALVVERGADDVSIRIEQTAGAVPLTALLEPSVARATAAEVDGVPADLAFRETDEGIVVPVQVVLDDTRTLRIRAPA